MLTNGFAVGDLFDPDLSSQQIDKVVKSVLSMRQGRHHKHRVYRDGSERFPMRPKRVHAPPAVSTDTNCVASYDVEAVLAQRGGRDRKELLVRWEGYGTEHDQWQPRSELARTVVAEAPHCSR